MEPTNRPRRLRRTKLIRELVGQTTVATERLIQPYFVTDGVGVKVEIGGMPGIYRESVDSLMESIESDYKLGLDKVMLFGVTDRKDAKASSAADDKNPVVAAVKKLKDKFGDDLFVSADVCLCAYTDTGHCGVTIDGEIDNDSSLPILAKMALVLAQAGCDCVAPSDMMDGRVGAIRETLEAHDLANTIIMAYTAKYASSYYGPFREAAGSAPGKGDRKGYQMDFRNRTEALRELMLDEEEGADIVMVKPALAYLDIIADFQRNTELPVAAYNVSGEYATVKLMVQAGQADEKSLVFENLTAITRAGASIILTYHLRDILKNEWRQP
ncbi:MAG: porphobilinogen synthase [candidate division Zixibacteria bacterium]|nr:porphobilinogen synthase [candidate division Zixibacteria bacterium]MDH3937491.1 porphobilinogen synthase [candidate division Zixibacteria bacterium]MDH4035490.1 porphobilinogen synthase [candidate division Zixibacteria bacterium]